MSETYCTGHWSLVMRKSSQSYVGCFRRMRQLEIYVVKKPMILFFLMIVYIEIIAQIVNYTLLICSAIRMFQVMVIVLIRC